MQRISFKPWQWCALTSLGFFAVCMVFFAALAGGSTIGFLLAPPPGSPEAQLSVAPSGAPTLDPAPTDIKPTSTLLLPARIAEPTATDLPTESPPTATFTVFVLPTQPPVIPIARFPHTCIPTGTKAETASVVSVTDGDTIRVLIDGLNYPVRYIGIDAPESTIQTEAYGAEASAKNAELVSGKSVTLVKDVSEVDQYNRLLRYVLVGDVFVNLELVKAGYATAVTFPPDVACYETFRQAEAQARSALVGLWAVPFIPTQVRLPTVPPLVPTAPSGGGRSGCDPSYPDVCIASPPPDKDCKDVPYKRFRVLPPDPHNFDGNHDGVGCEGP